MIGSSSAVGTALRKLTARHGLNLKINNAKPGHHLDKMGRSKASRAYAINFFKSVLLMPPIGLISAKENIGIVKSANGKPGLPEEQSYFVK